MAADIRDAAAASSSTTVLAWKLCGDFASAVCASIAVSPVVASMDRAITKNAAGAQPLWPALADGLKELAKRPLTNLTSVPSRWLMLVYSATYGAANSANTICKHFGYSPSLPVLGGSTAANMSTGVAKDRAFARTFGVVAPRPLPLGSYALFFTRDALAMAFIFNLPPTVALQLQEYGGLNREAANFGASFTTPVLSQILTTPLHLLGLSLYNVESATFGMRMEELKRTYPPTLLLRMIRIVPAFSVGGIVNRGIRESWHD